MRRLKSKQTVDAKVQIQSGHLYNWQEVRHALGLGRENERAIRAKCNVRKVGRKSFVTGDDVIAAIFDGGTE